jgi:hypothetical protein
MTDETRQSPAETVSHAGTPWRCFHCDDVFSSRSEASAHFGYQVDATPACKIAPDLRGLVKFIRWQESQLQRYRSENSDAARQFYALGADHAQALRCEEEKGYARGLADARAEQLSAYQRPGGLMSSERSRPWQDPTLTDETRQSPAEAVSHASERALTEMVLARWRTRFPNNAYAWSGAPESFAIEAVRTVCEQLTAYQRSEGS